MFTGLAVGVSGHVVAFAEYRLTVCTDGKVAFAASTSEYTLVIQDLFLGINAHINYDLTYILHEININPNHSWKLQDHNHINEILGSLIDTAHSAIADLYTARDLQT